MQKLTERRENNPIDDPAKATYSLLLLLARYLRETIGPQSHETLNVEELAKIFLAHNESREEEIALLKANLEKSEADLKAAQSKLREQDRTL